MTFFMCMSDSKQYLWEAFSHILPLKNFVLVCTILAFHFYYTTKDYMFSENSISSRIIITFSINSSSVIWHPSPFSGNKWSVTEPDLILLPDWKWLIMKILLSMDSSYHLWPKYIEILSMTIPTILVPNPLPGQQKNPPCVAGWSIGQPQLWVLPHVCHTLYPAMNTWSILCLPLQGLGGSTDLFYVYH